MESTYVNFRANIEINTIDQLVRCVRILPPSNQASIETLDER